MANNPHPLDNPPVLADEVTTRNGIATVLDSASRKPVAQFLGMVLRTADGVVVDVSGTAPFPVKDAGTFGYAAGTAAGNVDVPTGARIKRVNVVAGATVAATVTILAGNTITIPAGGTFDEQIPGDALGTAGAADVVIGGTIQAFYVSWVV